MDPQKLQSFLVKAEDGLTSTRGSLILFAQRRISAAELNSCCRRLNEFKNDAQDAGLHEVARLTALSVIDIERLASSGELDNVAEVNSCLDAISKLEAELLKMPLGSDDFLADVDRLIESSFEQFTDQSKQEDLDPDDWNEEFEIDDETLEIFRSEADGLLANIDASLQALRVSPQDSNALWDIRRNAHTFKGASGIIGFSEASKLAHRVEDLLDKLVEARGGADGRIIDLLAVSTDRLGEMVAGHNLSDESGARAALYAEFDRLLESINCGPIVMRPVDIPVRQSERSAPAAAENVAAAAPVSVVRVSLERLDELLDLSAKIISEHSAIAADLTELRQNSPQMRSALERLTTFIDEQKSRSLDMRHRLQKIRMVRFGVLEMRLNRAVHVTCQDENKKAQLLIHNPEVEIDTLVIDALIEPLLHLLKNAIVHGIEPPETRRILGKQEKGTIGIYVSSIAGEVTLSVTDDGRGISAAKLIEKALSVGILDSRTAASMPDFAAHNLIFQRGLTTADSLNLNAGRGVGMSIVKESVESRGGSLSVESEPQKGTRFTLRMPIALPTSVENETVEAIIDCAKPLVLIVDDSASIRRMASKMVEESGWRAVTAENGAEAVKLLLSDPDRPDLILSDVEMPVMDGWQFLEQIKSDYALSRIPVVMVTSLASDEHREKAIGLGAVNYLVKPFSRAEFERVCEIFEKINV